VNPITALRRGARLADLTWTDLEEDSRARMLVVPLGSTEQHGPHLPLSCDTDIAVTLSMRLAEARPDAVVAPPLPFGSSGEHAGFPGTLSIGQDALETVLVELARSATDTFAHVLFVSAHGGNAAPAQRACHRLRGEGRDVALFSPCWEGDLHAGHSETSMLLALEPRRVHMDRAVVGDTRTLEELWAQLRHEGVRAVSPTGVLGDPTHAEAAQGDALLERLALDLVEAVEAWVGAP
jgi:mycofactocin system creatininase family protein